MAAPFPLIFISATSSDLRSARSLVADTLTSLGYQPIWQNIAATDGGVLLNVLEERVAPCDAVLQLVGTRYGAEPPQPHPKFGRISYTQFEALYAEQIGKKVIYITLDENFPIDPCEPESEEKRVLQAAYRQSLRRKGVLRHGATGMVDLENRVLRIRDELALLRAEFVRARRRIWIAGAVGFVVLLGVAAGVWKLRQSSRVQEAALTSIQSGQNQEKGSLVEIDTNQQKQTAIVTQIDARVQEIVAMPMEQRADRLEAALSSADVAGLDVIEQAHISPREIQTVLARTAQGSDKTVADEFFESSNGQPAAIDWMKREIKDGLNPNMLLPDASYGQKALLLAALRQSNAAAAVALLEGGASPHPYENIYEVRTENPAFLFPYSAVTASETLSRTEKASLFEALSKAGASLFNVTAVHGETWDNRPIKAAQDAALAVGVKLADTPALDSGVAPVIARELDARDGSDWGQFCSDVPKSYKLTKGIDIPLLGFHIRNFIGSYGGMGYFSVEIKHWDSTYAMTPPPFIWVHGLLEVSKDKSAWTLYEWGGGELSGATGDAKAPPGQAPFPSSWDLPCWRAYSFVYNPDKKQITCDFNCEYASE